ncbi:uncharacterized protein LOC131804581 [Musca domestica]|uniref:Uncharacterized protein LOC131804581 n=1 Tax=Musca domestica TaxID=7370 RepID=A0ABM3VCW5_MUSDO|nr:uncharacterized protein LOC131804581 [Musca domestica]
MQIQFSKYCLSLILLSYLQLSQSTILEEAVIEYIQSLVQICGNESGLSEQDIHLIASDQVDDLYRAPISDNFKCFLHCFYLKLNLFDENGQPIVSEYFKEYIGDHFSVSEDKAAAAMEKCAAIRDENKCENVIKVELCIMDVVNYKY